MQEYDIKRGHYKNIEGGLLKEIAKDVFGEYKEEKEKLIMKYGALDPLAVWIKDKKTLCVDTNMKTDVANDVAAETVKKYNDFLYRSTGFTSKERRSRLQKKAKKGEL